jgi:hypothetical protein
MDGDGNCYTIPSDTNTNASTMCGPGKILGGGSDGCVVAPVDTNTNAATLCNTGEFLDGSGGCVALGGGGDITDVVAGTGLTGGAASGSATLNIDVGTTANKIVQLNGSGQLPSIDGSLLIGVGDVLNGGQPGALSIGTNDATTFTIETSNTPVVTVLGDGKVGIGSLVPTQALDVVGKLKIVDGTEGVSGRVLTTDGTGVTSWTDLPAGGDMTKAIYDGVGDGTAVDNSRQLNGFSSAYHLNVDNHVTGATNKLFTAAEQTKLSGIEMAADVTDAINVGAAGAVMDTDFTGADKVMVGTGVGTYGEVGVATANTVSTIVKRDGSGNFNAGAITASLFMGNGSGLTSVIADSATNVTGIVALANGGTGATTAAAARTGLGIGAAGVLGTSIASGNVVVYDSGPMLPAVDGSQLSNLTIVPAGAPTEIQYNNAGSVAASPSFIWNDTNKRLGVGESTPLSGLHVSEFTSAAMSAAITDHRIATTGAVTTNTIGIIAMASDSPSGTNSGSSTGIMAEASNDSAGTLSYLTGGKFEAKQGSTGTSTWATGVTSSVHKNSGTIGSAAAFYVEDVDATNGIGLKIEDLTSANAYGIYQDGPDDDNYFAGNTGFGIMAPAAAIHVAPTGAGSAPSWQSGDVAILESGANTTLQVFSMWNQTGAVAFSGGTRNAGLVEYNHNNNDMKFTTNSAEAMIITSAGKVGVGTATPTATLHVAGAVSIGDDGGICSGPTTGTMQFNPTYNRMEFCDGNAWMPLGVTPESLKVTFAGTNVSDSEAVKSALCVTEFGAGYTSAKLLELLFLYSGTTSGMFRYAVGDDPTKEYYASGGGIYSAASSSFEKILCIYKRAPIRVTATNYAAGSGSASYDTNCSSEFGNDYLATSVYQADVRGFTPYGGTIDFISKEGTATKISSTNALSGGIGPAPVVCTRR